VVHDCCKPDFLKQYEAQFDIVSATFLLNYATEEAMIQSFVDSAFTVLKPGGRFVGINTSPFVTTGTDFAKTHKYKLFYTTDREECQEGDPLHIRIEGDGFEAKFDNYFWKAETYERAFSQAGFNQFRWVPLKVTAKDQAEWAEWKEHTPLICFEAAKQ